MFQPVAFVDLKNAFIIVIDVLGPNSELYDYKRMHSLDHLKP